MTIDPDQHEPRTVYGYLIDCVTPRPVGWIGTRSADGTDNLAPYSFFNGVAASPPTVLFCATADRHGQPKHSLVNARDTGEFTVSVVSFDLAGPMNLTSVALPAGQSEFEHAGLTPVPGTKVRAPYVGEARIKLECVVHQIVPVGQGPLSASIVIGRIVLIHADDAVLTDGRPDPAKLDTVGRMGGADYCRTTERFSLPRP